VKEEHILREGSPFPNGGELRARLRCLAAGHMPHWVAFPAHGHIIPQAEENPQSDLVRQRTRRKPQHSFLSLTSASPGEGSLEFGNGPFDHLVVSRQRYAEVTRHLHDPARQAKHAFLRQRVGEGHVIIDG
jgi:hypothetical protein